MRLRVVHLREGRPLDIRGYDMRGGEAMIGFEEAAIPPKKGSGRGKYADALRAFMESGMRSARITGADGGIVYVRRKDV